MTVDYQKSGSNMGKTQLQGGSVPFQAKAFGLMMKREATGGQSLSTLTIKTGTSTSVLGMTTPLNTVN